VDVTSGVSSNGTPIVLWSCHGGANQAWSVPGDGTLRSLNKCLDVRWGSTSPGAPVQLWDCNGSGAQQWVVNGMNLVNPNSRLCLDVPGSNSADGARLETWTCGAQQLNQSWTVGVGPGQGRVRDFYDDFNAGLASTWGKYGYGRQAPGNGAMGLYDLSNVYVSGGNLTLRTQFSNGAWTSAGVSSGKGYSAYQGEWQIRARFDQAKGIGYAFLLYPNDSTWPPEIDIAEGKVNGPSVMSTLHWAPNNQQIQKWNTVPDMTAWHTYGVIIEPSTITYTLDGVPWTSFATANAPTKKMWIGLQTGAMSCPSAYECVPGGIPNAATPTSSTIQIDWVAHYQHA